MSNRNNLRQYFSALIWSIKNINKIKSYIGREENEFYHFNKDLIFIEKKLNIGDISFEEILQKKKLKFNKFDILKKNLKWSLTDYELLILMNLIPKLENKNILEIGTFEGRTTLNIAKNTKANVYTIDLPQNKINQTRDKFVVGKHFKQLNLKNLKQLSGSSLDFDYKKLNVSFDFIFVDGCHEYENAYGDTLNAFNNLNKGGILLWHDYTFNMTKNGIVSALDKLNLENSEIFKIYGTSFLVLFKK